MSIVLPKPKSVTSEDVVLSRADWERLVTAVENLESDEDADDIAAVAAARAENAALAARLEAERGCPVETTIPMEVVEAELDGVHPVRAWRERRKWTRSQLASESGVTRDLIAQIETRRKTGSVQALNRLALTLAVPLDALIEDDDENRKIGETR
jgi:ribosome-binding protein aMBF1 (putative translation factor)